MLLGEDDYGRWHKQLFKNLDNDVVNTMFEQFLLIKQLL